MKPLSNILQTIPALFAFVAANQHGRAYDFTQVNQLAATAKFTTARTPTPTMAPAPEKIEAPKLS
jgi:hypothetical protein